ncbi:inhibitor of cysteine protease 1 [Cystoisospora suis]|uniref:Inhibitor of cysteine protease 1 n=1 Tax=Cystoisospora suis TaxID=483139 RepID=A0A2C6LH37_9APIC|nr:inhibitor of cysteine protease 1 [Cystoisospora suis]
MKFSQKISLVFLLGCMVGLACTGVEAASPPAEDPSDAPVLDAEEGAGPFQTSQHVKVDFRKPENVVYVRAKRETGFGAKLHFYGGTGYIPMISAIHKGFHVPEKFEVPLLSGEEMFKRIESPFTQHGVRVEAPRPDTEHRNPPGMTGGPQVYASQVTAETPGDYSIVYTLVRPWSPSDSPRHFVVFARLD